MSIRSSFKFRAAYARSLLLTKVADVKLRWKQYRDSKKRGHWIAAKITGGTVNLGYMTRKEALKHFRAISDDHIKYIDDEDCCIIHGDMPQMPQ